MSENSKSTIENLNQSLPSTRSNSPELISWSPSNVPTQRENLLPQDPNSILREQVDILFRQVENTNRTVQNLGEHFDHLRDRVDNQFSIINQKFSNELDCIRRKYDVQLECLNRDWQTFDKKLESLNKDFNSQLKPQVPDKYQGESLITNKLVQSSPSNISTYQSENSGTTPNDLASAKNHAETCDNSNIPSSLSSGIMKQNSVSQTIPSPSQHSKTDIGFTKPGYFDGKSSWTDYQIHFETVAKLNRWPNDIKALKLIACMRDAALATLMTL